jgi:hypothetical protein
MEYNLLEEKWIPVLWNDGEFSRVGIRKALTKAGRIRQIAASNPMDNVALLRFLLAVLWWCRSNLTDEQRKTLESADGIKDDWLEKMDRHKEKFDLLDDTYRFYQDRQLLDDILKAKQSDWDKKQEKRKSSKPSKTPRPPVLADDDYRPIGDLLQELPTETQIAHFRHVRDGNYGLCPSCCAIGIVRLSAFANAYGHGKYTAAVNGPTPAYAIPEGWTLLQTLMLNWPEKITTRREPPWIWNQPPSQEELDEITVFAWRSRRLWLGDRGSLDEPCAHCGQRAHLIRKMAFSGNWKPPIQTKGTQKKFWNQDPHLILEQVSSKKKEAEDSDDNDKDQETNVLGESPTNKSRTVTTLGFPIPASLITAHTRFWRRAHSAILSHVHPRRFRTMPLRINIAGPAANKGLYQDATNISLPAISTDSEVQARVVLDLMARITSQLIKLLSQSTPNKDRQHRNRRAALDALSPALEKRLSQVFCNFAKSPTSASGVAQIPTESWCSELIQQLTPIIDAVVVTSTPGSPLRRREAAELARTLLDREIRNLVKEIQKQIAFAKNEQT